MARKKDGYKDAEVSGDMNEQVEEVPEVKPKSNVRSKPKTNVVSDTILQRSESTYIPSVR